MNLLSFNHVAVAPFTEPKNIEKCAAGVATFPLFTMESGEIIPAETIEALRGSKLGDLLPYNGIRLYDRMDDGTRVNEWLLIIEKGQNKIHVWATAHSIFDKATKLKRIAPANGAAFVIHDELDAKCCFYSCGKAVAPEEYTNPKACDDYSNTARHVLFSFLANLLNPHMHLATVRPDKQGKSVEWTRQRTHFVFIHKSHQANKVGFTGKADVCDKHVLRMAHSRRAHFRVLRHPKWKDKVGTKIRVKSCWVGPKSWKGNSGQIYRIVE